MFAFNTVTNEYRKLRINRRIYSFLISHTHIGRRCYKEKHAIFFDMHVISGLNQLITK